MAKKKSKSRHARKAHRMQQSRRDKTESYWKLGRQLADPLGDYRLFLQNLRSARSAGLRDVPDYLHIPINMIDLTASLLASLIIGKDVMHCQHTQTPEQKAVNDAFLFIRRVIKRTRLSFTTLLLGLFFIHRSRLMRKGGRGRGAARGRGFGGGGGGSGTLFFGYGDSLGDRSLPVDSTARTTTPPTKHKKSSGGVVREGDALESESLEERCIPLFLASVICADKYLYDATYTNADWTEFTEDRYTLSEINAIERSFLQSLDYNLFVTDAEYDSFLAYLDVMLCMRRSLSLFDGWSASSSLLSLTYRDLYSLSSSVPDMYLRQVLSRKGRGNGTRGGGLGGVDVDGPNMMLGPYDATVLIFGIVVKYVATYAAALAVALTVAAVAVHVAGAPGAVIGNVNITLDVSGDQSHVVTSALATSAASIAAGAAGGSVGCCKGGGEHDNNKRGGILGTVKTLQNNPGLHCVDSLMPPPELLTMLRNTKNDPFEFLVNNKSDRLTSNVSLVSTSGLGRPFSMESGLGPVPTTAVVAC
ncbi:hypothetical protein HK102_011195 [Quaeritorhiza haematococci]|nr:hypothetical protein HK102_011195 [Quaeritorhiza haematococci]